MDAAGFEEHRAHLFGVAYRMTGSRADAEDAVQEAWLRYASLDDAARAGLRDVRAWLATVVGRICLDRLRSAAARRERYVGPWLPEPLVAEDSGQQNDPLAVVVRDESMRMAAMVVLERLTPPQRVAFVLREALDLPYTDIADVLGCPEPTARQHVARARRTVAEADPPPRAPSRLQREVLVRFADAVARADRHALVELLHPEAVWVTDSDGRAKANLRPIVGADKIVRFTLGLRESYGAALTASWRPVVVNGDPGVYIPGGGGVSRGVVTVAIVDDRIAAIYFVVNPHKLDPNLN